MRQALKLTASGHLGPLEAGGPTPHGHRRVILLVHGFNNDEQQAGASYSTMRRNLDRLLREEGHDQQHRRAVQETIWEFHWPGYLRAATAVVPRRGLSETISGLAYSVQVPKARGAVPEALADYCTSLGAVELSFVAHSLGCRVVLETVDRLARDPRSRVRVGGVLLMAAAVPMRSIGTWGKLNGAARVPSRRFCFHSWRDRILLVPFPLGQTLAGEPSAMAVGLSGRPSIWHGRRNTRFGHSDYWTDSFRRLGDYDLATVIDGLFLVTVARSVAASELPSNEIEEAYGLPEVRLAERRLQGSDWLDDLCTPH